MGFSKDWIPALFMEFLGTAILGFTIATGANVFAIGVALGVLVYIGGKVSGGCYNPAVALACNLVGALGDGNKDWVKMAFYFLAEFLGGFVGHLFGYLARADDGQLVCLARGKTFTLFGALIVEIMMAGFLCYTVLATACAEAKKDNHYYGWCIGFALFVGLTGANINGGSLNPAMYLGNMLSSSMVKPENNTCAEDNWEHIWWQATFPFIGSLMAWGIVLFTTGKGKLEKFAPFFMEFIGTMFFVYAISLSWGNSFAAVVIGTALAIVVYCGGHISGGHYNPAVTFGAWLRGCDGLDWKKMLIYFASQLLGAFTGALLAYISNRYDDDEVPSGMEHPVVHPKFMDDTDTFAGILAEFVMTFFLVLTVLMTATWDQVADNNYFGLAIGYSVVAGASGIGSTSTGGAMNPAVFFGTNLMQCFHDGCDGFGDIWAFYIAEFLGGLAAAFAFKLLTGIAIKMPGKGGSSVSPA